VKHLSLVDTKSFLTCFEHNAGPNLWTKHHLGAVHVVIHDILKSWLTSVLVDHEEENLFVSGYLDSHIAFDKIDFSAHVLQSVVFSPHTSFKINFEEKDGA
jgi:hypothetical protein